MTLLSSNEVLTFWTLTLTSDAVEMVDLCNSLRKSRIGFTTTHDGDVADKK